MLKVTLNKNFVLMSFAVMREVTTVDFSGNIHQNFILLEQQKIWL